MYHYSNSVVNKQGDVLPGYFVQVVDQTTNLVVPIFADKSSTPIITISGVANMAKVDANGIASFYIPDGSYNLNVYAQDNTTLKASYLDVPMVSTLSLSVGTVATLAAGATATASIDTSSGAPKINLGLPTGATGGVGPAGTSGNPAAVRERLGIFNAFDIAGVVTGHLISNGVDSATGGFNATGFIPVEPGSIVFSISNGFTAQYGAAFYDATQTFIAGSNTSVVVAGTPITAPAGAAYVRTSYPSTVDLTLLQVVRGTTLPTVFQPFGNPLDVTNFASARTTVDDATVFRRTLFNPLNITSSSIISNTGAVSTLAGYFVTNYMVVTPGGAFTTYPASNGLTSGYGPTFYDKNKGRVSNSATDSPFAANTTFTVPSNAYYVRMTVNNSQLSTFTAVPGSAAVVRPSDHKPAVVSDANQWAGRNFCFLGDSILAAQGGWPLAQLMPLVGGLLDTKHAAYVSGRQLAAGLTDASSVAFVAGDFATTDYVHIELITNNLTSTIGTSADSSATASVWGWYKNIIGTLQGWNPSMRITMQTPFYRGDGTIWAGIAPYLQACNDVGAYYGIPVWQAHQIGGWGPGNIATQLQGDFLHPTASGVTNGCLPALRSFIMSQYPNT